MILSFHYLTILVLCFVFSSFSPTNCRKESRNRSIMKGLTFRVSGFNYPPCFSTVQRPSGNYTYVGICRHMVDHLAQRFEMNVIFVPANVSDIGSLGLGPALVKQMTDGAVDFIPWAYAPTPSLLQQIDVTIPLRVEDFFLLQAWPKEKSRLTAIVRPFTPTVWGVFIISIIGVVITMSSIRYVCQERDSTCRSISFLQWTSNCSVYVFTILTNQGNNISKSMRFSFRIIAGVWCLTMVVFGNAFTSSITSYLAVPKFEPIVNTLTELAASTKLKLTVDFDSDLSKLFLRAKNGPYKALGNTLRKHPNLLITTSVQGIANVLKGEAVYPVSKTVLHFAIILDMKSRNTCRLTASDSIPYIQTYTMGLPKNGAYNNILNKDFQYLWENGLLHFWFQQYSPKLGKCMILKKVKPHGKVVSYSLVELASAFAVLGVGVGVSLLTFLVEACIWKKIRFRN